MKKNRLLENLNQSIGSNIPMKRYSLADMISESYKMIYGCNEGTNLKMLAESHLDDVRQNPREIERLSRQLCILKEVSRMVESNDLKDEDLVDKKSFDTVDPKEDRVIVQNECNECDDPNINKESPRKYRRHTKEACTSKKESIKEAEDPDLTDEELEELAKHLETIRKERKDAPKTEMKEDVTPKRRGIKCHIADSNEPRKEINEATESHVIQYGVDILTEDNQHDIDYKIEYALTKAGLKVVGCQPTDASWSIKEYEKLTGMSVSDILGESKKEKIEDCNESKSYRGLENFKKQSESKAFYKTFKKMHESLKEGKALTRQESIDLYKASNSALTQLSIELEHNPDFLGTFKESVSLLSKDVSSLLESLTRGKAPSKATMRSLAKFSEYLLNEAKEEKTYTIIKERNGRTSESTGTLSELISEFSYTLEAGKSYENEKGNKKIDKQPKTITSLIKNLNNATNNAAVNGYSGTTYSLKESISINDLKQRYNSVYGYDGEGHELEGSVEKVLSYFNDSDKVKFLGKLNGEDCYQISSPGDDQPSELYFSVDESKKVNESDENHPEYASDFKVLDTIPVGPDYIIQICYVEDTYSENHYGVQVVDNDGEPVNSKEVDDLTFDKFFKTESDAREVVNKLVPIISTKYSVNESDEEDFVGDDEGDVQSEEADAFDQEYADARFELHSDLEAKHADDEDPEVQEKLAQDAEEVINLPGTTEEQIAQINGEESTEEPESTTDEPEEGEVDDEITDDELEELKKHLKEMRSARK